MKKVIYIFLIFSTFTSSLFCFTREEFFSAKKSLNESVNKCFDNEKIIFCKQEVIVSDDLISQECLYISPTELHLINENKEKKIDLFLLEDKILYVENGKIMDSKINVYIQKIIFNWWDSINEDTELNITTLGSINILRYTHAVLGPVNLIVSNNFELLQLEYIQNNIKYIQKYKNYKNISGKNTFMLPMNSSIFVNNVKIKETTIQEVSLIDYCNEYFDYSSYKEYTFMDSIKDFFTTLGGGVIYE